MVLHVQRRIIIPILSDHINSNSMKRILTIITALTIASANAFAQQTASDDAEYIGDRIAREWSQAFSKEGKQKWETEYTCRLRTGFFTDGVMFTGGIRVDEKRTLGLFTGLENVWDDAAPANSYSARLGLTYRRYWHLGQRKIFAFYSDLYAGAAYIYKDTDPDPYYNSQGDLLFVGGWQTGVRIRFYKNIHMFLGPTIATDCIGLHLGIGF